MSQVLTADACPNAPRSTPPTSETALFEAAKALLPVLTAGRPLDANVLRDAMTRAFGASDAEGAWVWKDAYEAVRGGGRVVPQALRPGHAPPGRGRTRRPRRHAGHAAKTLKPRTLPHEAL